MALPSFDQPTNVTGLQKLGDSPGILRAVSKALPNVLRGSEERLVRCLISQVQSAPKLMDCAPKTLFGALIQTAQLGLELGGPAGQAYLIPFKGSAQLVIGYKGYLALIHRNPKTRRVTPRTVFEKDVFDIEYGVDQRLIHKPFLAGDPGHPIGYYTVYEADNGGRDFEFMTKQQAEIHRNRFALSQKGPWLTNFDEQAMKTTIRKLSKRLPMNVELTRAAALDEQGDEGVDQSLASNFILELPANAGPDHDLEAEIEMLEAKQQEGKA